MIKNNREYRAMTLAVSNEESAEMVVEGYATTFNEPYLLWQDENFEFWEMVDKNAFDDCDMSDVIFQYDHEGRVFARLKNKTLAVYVDNKGLFITADLGGTDIGRQLYQEIKGGYTDKMSFGFVVAEEKREIERDMETGKEKVLRIITKIEKLYDVSAVSIPANDATTISARNFCNGVIEEIQTERFARAEMKNKIKILLEV